MPPRLVLNARRPGFDLSEGVQLPQQPQPQQHPWELSAQGLRAAFKVHADPGNKRLVRGESATVFFFFCLFLFRCQQKKRRPSICLTQRVKS